MSVVDTFFQSRQELYDYFGYVEDWHIYPIEDHRQYYWFATKYEVRFSTLPDLDDEDKHYSYDLLNDRFLETSTYVTDAYTMILVDTHTDGNKFLVIFDNEKELPL